MEYRDISEILSFIAFVALVAGAGAAGYFVGRFHEAQLRHGAREPRSRRRKNA